MSAKANALLGLSPPPSPAKDMMYNLSIDSFSSFNPSFNSLLSDDSRPSVDKQTGSQERSPTSQTVRPAIKTHDEASTSETYVNDVLERAQSPKQSRRRPSPPSVRRSISLQDSAAWTVGMPYSRDEYDDSQEVKFHIANRQSMSPWRQHQRPSSIQAADRRRTQDASPSAVPRKFYEHDRSAKLSHINTHHTYEDSEDYLPMPHHFARPTAASAMSLADFLSNDELVKEEALQHRSRPAAYTSPSLASVRSFASLQSRCIHGPDCCLTGCAKKLKCAARKSPSSRLLAFPAFSQTLGLECILNEAIVKLDTSSRVIDPRRWKSKKGYWVEKTLIVTTNARQAQGALPSKLASLTGTATLGTNDFSFEGVRADEAFAALHCCRDNANGTHSREEERLLLASDSYVAVAETSSSANTNEKDSTTRWVLKVAGTELSSSRKAKTRAQELEKQVWHLQFDTLGRLLHWQKTLRALIKALLATEEIFRNGERPQLSSPRSQGESVFEGTDPASAHSPKSSYDSVVRKRVGSNAASVTSTTAMSTPPSSWSHLGKARQTRRAHLAGPDATDDGRSERGEPTTSSVQHAFSDGKNLRQARAGSSSGHNSDSLGPGSRSVNLRSSGQAGGPNAYYNGSARRGSADHVPIYRRGSTDKGTSGRARAVSRAALAPPAMPAPTAQLPQTPLQKKESVLGLECGKLHKSNSSDAIHERASSSRAPSPPPKEAIRKSPSMLFPLPLGHETGRPMSLTSLGDSDSSFSRGQRNSHSSPRSEGTSATTYTNSTYGSEPKTPSARASRSPNSSTSPLHGQSDSFSELASFLEKASPSPMTPDLRRQQDDYFKSNTLSPPPSQTPRSSFEAVTSLIDEYVVPTRQRQHSAPRRRADLPAMPLSPAFASSNDSDSPPSRGISHTTSPAGHASRAISGLLSPPPARPGKSPERKLSSIYSDFGVDADAYAM